MSRYLQFFLIIYFSIIPISSVFSAQSAPDMEKKRILTSFSIIEDITKNIGRDLVIVNSVVQPGVDSHAYQARPTDIIHIPQADLILCNGLGLEESFMKYFVNLKKGTKIVYVAQGIQPIAVSEDASAEEEPNPHSWLSLNNALIYIKNIRNALKELDPPNAAAYDRNADEYAQQIRDAVLPLKEKLMAVSPNDRWIVTSEGCLVYLAEELGYTPLYLWSLNSDAERSPAQMREVIDLIRKNKIKFIFSEASNSNQPAKQVARETNATYGGVLYVDSLTKPGGVAPTYLQLLRLLFSTILGRVSQ
ncbi:MAG: metal ABC transporter substrate-binding protein [Candidatus Liberibacter ctenarytainae]|uniref:Metal ABC transporter substrate-binding protein n=1 Tax=Candidatus Liberibacter ctenarytainae TaxID=2020335 RepID=A0A937AQS3_9HYPH|nr:metal ABC transporter substrate-binding protein [Candidatus Liberibacter ctenarytainae]